MQENNKFLKINVISNMEKDVVPQDIITDDITNHSGNVLCNNEHQDQELDISASDGDTISHMESSEEVVSKSKPSVDLRPSDVVEWAVLANSQKEQEMLKPIKLELPNGEHFWMYIPTKTCSDHFYYLLNLTTNPKYDGHILNDLILAFPNLTVIEAIKIHALFMVFADPSWEVNRIIEGEPITQ